MKKCGKCFRCKEDKKTAMEIGLKTRKLEGACHFLWSCKPRTGAPVSGMGMTCKDPMSLGTLACEHYKSRFVWNAGLVWENVIFQALRFPIRVIAFVIGYIKKPLPMSVGVQCGVGDVPSYYLECPRCHEFAYEKTYCVFCGQRFIKDSGISEKAQKDIDEMFANEKGHEKQAPCPLFPEDDDLICMICGWTDSDEFDNDNDKCSHDDKLDKDANTCSMFSCGEQCRECPPTCQHLCPIGRPGGVSECKDCSLPCPSKGDAAE